MSIRDHVWKCAWTLLIIIPLFLSCDDKEIRLDLEVNGGLILPDDFEALAVVNRLDGKARHIALNDNGDLYVKLRHAHKGQGNAVLRDTTNDGRVDVVKYFGDYQMHGAYGTGMRIHKDYLYYSSQTIVYRQKLLSDEMVPSSKIDTIVMDDSPNPSREHIAKPIAFDDQGHIYVPFGAPSNACQDPKRTPGIPGLDPCPQLDTFGGVWRFEYDKLNQFRTDGCKFATGIRSLVCLEWDSRTNGLYTVMHGRDDLLRLFPEHFSPWQSAVLPSEEFLRIEEDGDYGWPYCYYDHQVGRKVLAPEYGGNGHMVGRCSNYDDPIYGFPGHWAPNDLLFYTGQQFPGRYRDGAFVAFHGSTNRGPYPQSGYFVAFVPFADGRPTGEWEIFADGFARIDTIVDVSDAVFRPMGLSQGPDGSLYVAETEHGAIWKISYEGRKTEFGQAQLANMEKRKRLIHIKTPHPINDNLQREVEDEGEYQYLTYCGTCHQGDGRGDESRFPPLNRTKRVKGDKEELISIVLNGMSGQIEVKGKTYAGLMPGHSFLSDEDIAKILTYIRKNFGNRYGEISISDVKAVREKLRSEDVSM